MMKTGKDTAGRLKMPKYRIIIQETKSYFVEADNEELASWQVKHDLETLVQSRTLDHFEIEEVIDVGSLVEKFGT